MIRSSVFRTLIAIFLIISLSACAGSLYDIGAQTLSSQLYSGDMVDTVPRPGISQAQKTERQGRNRPAQNFNRGSVAAFPKEEAFTEIYQKVNPSVVNIQVTMAPEGDNLSSPNGVQIPFAPFRPGLPGFPDFHFPEMPEITPMPQSGQGSGFLYDRAGHIVTNHHVVAGADKISVVFSSGREVEAALVGADPDTDLAVIRVDRGEIRDLLPVTIGRSEDLKVGQLVVSIGNPFGLSGSMSTGIISGLGRVLPANASQFSIPDIIQTDAAINPGNSGGPLLDLNGRVIGVNTAILSRTGAFAGIGYAIPVDTVREVVPELIREGQIAHPWLGISGRTLDRNTAEAMDLAGGQRGVLVVEVVADGPASEAGLRGSATQETIDGVPILIGGDVIVGVDDLEINDFDDLLSYVVHKTDVGQTIRVEYIRDGELQTADLILAARPTGQTS